MKLYILTAFDSDNDRHILGVYTTQTLADKAWDSWYAIASEDSVTEYSKHIEEATLNEREAKARLEDGQFGCMGPDPVAETNVLTLMRLIVAASGNSMAPPKIMRVYWDATTMPAVRAAAQALLDFKAAVEF